MSPRPLTAEQRAAKEHFEQLERDRERQHDRDIYDTARNR